MKRKAPPPLYNIKDPAVISVLGKLLGAARRAESEGKYLAMSKLMETARKISDRIGEEGSQTEFYSNLKKIKFYPEYIPVQGEIIE